MTNALITSITGGPVFSITLKSHELNPLVIGLNANTITWSLLCNLSPVSRCCILMILPPSVVLIDSMTTLVVEFTAELYQSLKGR